MNDSGVKPMQTRYDNVAFRLRQNCPKNCYVYTIPCKTTGSLWYNFGSTAVRYLQISGAANVTLLGHV